MDWCPRQRLKYFAQRSQARCPCGNPRHRCFGLGADPGSRRCCDVHIHRSGVATARSRQHHREPGRHLAVGDLAHARQLQHDGQSADVHGNRNDRPAHGQRYRPGRRPPAFRRRRSTRRVRPRPVQRAGYRYREQAAGLAARQRGDARCRYRWPRHRRRGADGRAAIADAAPWLFRPAQRRPRSP